MSEDGGSRQHGRAQNIHPGGQSHVERRVHLRVVDLDHGMLQVQLSHQARAGLEMLMPWDIREGVVGSTDGALKKDHAERGFENLLMVRVAIQRFAELGNGRVAVSHDVAVDFLPV